MPPAIAVGLVGGAIGKAVVDAEAAGQQERAYNKGRRESEVAWDQFYNTAKSTAAKSKQKTRKATASAKEQLVKGTNQGQDFLERGLGISDQLLTDTLGESNKTLSKLTQKASTVLGRNYDEVHRSLNTGFVGAHKQLDRGQAKAEAPLTALSQTQAIGTQAATDSGRVQALLDNPDSFRQDPGFQFRQQQGERALAAAGAARGGRGGGRQLKALAEFNSGLASQEFQAAFDRASQADAQAAQLSQFNAEQQNQAGLQAQLLGARGLQSLSDLRAEFTQNRADLETGRAEAVAQALENRGAQAANIQLGLGAQLSDNTLSTGQLRAENVLDTSQIASGNEIVLGTQLGQLDLDSAASLIGLDYETLKTLGASTEAKTNLALGATQFAGQGLASLGNNLGTGIELGAQYLAQGAQAAKAGASGGAA